MPIDKDQVGRVRRRKRGKVVTIPFDVYYGLTDDSKETFQCARDLGRKVAEQREKQMLEAIFKL